MTYGNDPYVVTFLVSTYFFAFIDVLTHLLVHNDTIMSSLVC